MSRNMATAWHPAPERLIAFESGELLEEHVPDVESHLAVCASCCEVLSNLSDEDFVARLRSAYQAAPTSSPLASTIRAPEFPAAPVQSRDEGLALPGFDEVQEVGRGGMGVVYSATHALMGRRVAVKVIHPEFAGHAVAVERFRREVHAAARLSHPNIVPAYDAGQWGDRLFLVMEHIDGESLADRLARLGPLPIAEACEAVRQAAQGVQHAHDNGLVHRDLKPHNLLRTADGVVKVCDFGLAALTDDRGRGRATAPNAVMGTPAYMAPEQAEDARRADGRADVYSLGCTLYHLLTGQVPFPEESTVLELLAHRTNERPSACRLRPEVSPDLDAVLRKAMARWPDDRYPTPAAWAEALTPFADPVHGVRTRKKVDRRARTVLVLAMIALLTATAMAGVVRFPAENGREIVIETDDPTIEVIAKGDRIVRIVDPKLGRAYRLDREDLTLSLLDEPDGLAMSLDGKTPIVLKRQGKRIATVRLEPTPGVAVAKGFERLFNGKDLTGWVADGGRAGAWRVEDGELVGAANGYTDSSYLLTEKSYSDFVLRFEYQLSTGGNSGVGLRAVPGERHPRWSSVPEHLEVQLADDSKHKSGHTGALYWSTSGLYLDPNRRAELKPAGFWNSMRIECQNGSLRVWVNDREVHELELDSLARQSEAKAGLKRSSGRVGFQQHTGEVRFRNVEIQELPSGTTGFLDPAEWHGLDRHWSIRDGVIRGTSGPERFDFNTCLCSRRKYRDFELSFEVRVTGDGWQGNSGVQIRSKLIDPARFVVRGPQCDVGEGYWGCLYEELQAGMLKEAPEGFESRKVHVNGYNDYFIRCVGKRVTIRINGETTVDEEFDEVPEEGIIGWQLHGTKPMAVTFRNITFEELSLPMALRPKRRAR